MNSSGKVSIGRLAVIGIALLCLVLIIASVFPTPVIIRGGSFLSISIKEVLANPDPTTNYCLEFDGTYGYTHRDSSVSGIGGQTAATIEGWVKRSAIGSYDYLFCVGNAGSYFVPYLRINSNDTITAMFGDGGGSNYRYRTTSAGLSDTSSWHYVVATYSSGTIHIYVDNSEWAGTSSGSYSGAVGTITDHLTIGAAWNGADWTSRFHGQIDEVRFSNVVRTSDERTEAWNSGNGTRFTNDSDTGCLFHFDEGDTRTAVDSSSNGNNLTLRLWITFAQNNKINRTNGSENVRGYGTQFMTDSDTIWYVDTWNTGYETGIGHVVKNKYTISTDTWGNTTDVLIDPDPDLFEQGVRGGIIGDHIFIFIKRYKPSDVSFHGIGYLRTSNLSMDAGWDLTTANFTGSGLDDMESGGSYNSTNMPFYRIQIDGTGTPNTFKWSNDAGSTWNTTGISITGSTQELEYGTTITFNSTTGHTLGDYWEFSNFYELTSLVGNSTKYIPYGHIASTSVAGTYLMPVYSESPTHWVKVFKTTDYGETWTMGGTIYEGSTDYNETCITYIGDQKLVALIRNDGGQTKLYQSTSSNDGENWTAPVITNLGVQANYAKVPWLWCDGDILIAMRGEYQRIYIAWGEADDVFSNPTYWYGDTLVDSTSYAYGYYGSFSIVSSNNYFLNFMHQASYYIGDIYTCDETAIFIPTWVINSMFPEAEITNSPSSNDFGILVVGTNSSTAINYFTLNNTGQCTVDVVIYGTDATGGNDTWVLSGDATPGEDTYGLYAGLDDDDDLFDVVVNSTANSFVSGLAQNVTQDWGLKLIMPTSVSDYDGQQMVGNITLVASVG